MRCAYDADKMSELNRSFRTHCETETEKYRDKLCLPEGPLEFVYGFGSAASGILLIGEAPGKDEVRLGRPFVGKAGAILTEILEHTGIDREDLYITNTMKYRLARAGKRPGTVANRPATALEIQQSTAWLQAELEEIRPKLILTLGNVPLKAMERITGCMCGEIGACHGTRIPCSFSSFEAVHIPLYHPASLIYNRGLRGAYDADMEEVRKWIQTVLKK